MMSDDGLMMLRSLMNELRETADDSAFNRAWKLACEGKLKRPENVNPTINDEGGISLTFEDPKENKWTVDYWPDGSFRMTLDFQGRSDSRITRMLKSVGEIHRR